MTDQNQKLTQLSLKDRLRELYVGNSETAHRFRYGLLIFDLATIAFVIVTSFVHWEGTEVTDTIIGVILLTDYLVRGWIAYHRRAYFVSFSSFMDIVVIVSLLAPIVGEGAAFLRVLRALRLVRSYQLLTRLRQDFDWFRRHENMALAALNLIIFLFVMSGIIYETQHYTNPKIANYFDALYFTVTALTTTGFGDIVLEGNFGRFLSILTMIVGISFFLRLVQVMLRPEKVDHKCPACGLRRHDHDAVHCKACGTILNIEDEGAV